MSKMSSIGLGHGVLNCTLTFPPRVDWKGLRILISKIDHLHTVKTQTGLIPGHRIGLIPGHRKGFRPPCTFDRNSAFSGDG